MSQFKTLFLLVALFLLTGCGKEKMSHEMEMKLASLNGGGTAGFVQTKFGAHDPLQTPALMNKRISRIYEVFLGRTPKSKELTYWTHAEPSLLHSELIIFLSESYEFRRKFNDEAAYVDGLLTALFGDKKVFAEKKDQFVARLDRGVQPWEIVLDLVMSEAFFQSVANEAHLRFLGHEALEGAGAEWLSNYENGQSINEQWLELLSSDTYKAASDEDVASRMYKQLLGREWNNQEQQAAKSEFDLNRKEERKRLAKMILESNEFTGVWGSTEALR